MGVSTIKGSIKIYTDGCRKKNGSGGWAAILINEQFIKVIGDCDYNTTCNKMELMGPMKALALVSHISIHKDLYCDSQYTVKGFNEWMYGWVRRGWAKKKEPLKNVEFWKTLWDLRDNVKMIWVRGHNGHKENEACDMLANVCCASGMSINETFTTIEELDFYLNTFKTNINFPINEEQDNFPD